MTPSPLWSLLDVPPTDARVRALMDAQQAELAARYEQDVAEPFDPAVLAGEGGALLAAERGTGLLGYGGLRRVDAQTAELRWIYTIPAARGLGLGRELLLALLERARQLGYERVVLETGEHQPEVSALYEAAGFRRVPGSGSSAGQEGSLRFELELGEGAG